MNKKSCEPYVVGGLWMEDNSRESDLRTRLGLNWKGVSTKQQVPGLNLTKCLIATNMSLNETLYLRGWQLFLPEVFWTDSLGAGHSNKIK